jgi:hypothetical protein
MELTVSYPSTPRPTHRSERGGTIHRPLAASPVLLLAITTLVFVSCSGDHPSITAPPSSPPVPGAMLLPDSIQAIFTESCAYQGCHAGPRPMAGLDLSPERAYATLVDVPSVSCPSRLRVRPGQPDSSCLIDRLSGRVEPMMPLAGWLPTDSRTIVVRWIESGAPGVASRSRPAVSARHREARR